MKFVLLQKQTSRREMLIGSVTLAGSAFLAHLVSTPLCASAMSNAQLAPSAADLLASMRAKFNAAPLKTQKLADNVTMLSGPGGSVVVLNGPDGKFVVDTFVAPAWPRLKKALDDLGNAPVKYVIDTHWHFDHTDNNAPFRAAGATIVAHENTKKRMAEPHDLPVLYRGPDGALASLHFDPSPAEALPQHIRGVMHLMFECAGRWELFNDRRNPMQMVRVKDSTKRRQRPTVLTVTEYEAILAMLKEPYRTMVIVANASVFA